MDKDCSEELSSANENSAEESSSVEEDSTEEISSTEEDSREDGNDTDVLDLELGKLPKDENSAEENNSTKEDSTEENNSTKEDSTEENNSTKEDSTEEDNSAKEDSTEEDSSLEEETSMVEEDSEEDDGSMDEDSADEKKENWIEEHGLVYQDIGSEDRTVKIVMVGSADCGKTELIESFFKDYPSTSIAKYPTRIECTISLSTRFHIWICDVKKTEFAKKETYSDKTVFFLCYDVDKDKNVHNLKRTWIPSVSEESVKEMFYFLVGIKREAKTEPKAKKLKTEEQKMAARVKCQNRIFKTASFIECCIDDKGSLLKVFQSAMDVVYPRL